MTDEPELVPNVRIEHEVHPLSYDCSRQGVQRLMRASPRPKSIRKAEKVLLVDHVQHRHHCALDYFVLQRRDPKRPLPAVGLTKNTGRNQKVADENVRSFSKKTDGFLEIIGFFSCRV